MSRIVSPETRRSGAGTRPRPAEVADRFHQWEIAGFERHSLAAFAIARGDKLADPLAETSGCGDGTPAFTFPACFRFEAGGIDPPPVGPQTARIHALSGRLGGGGDRQQSEEQGEGADHGGGLIAQGLSAG